MSTLGISMLYDRWFIWYKISQWGLGIGTGTICYLEQNDILTTPFFDQLQGTQIIDDSHDQDTTDLNKCIAFITRNPPGPDNSNVQQISYQCLLQISVCNTSLYRCYSVFLLQLCILVLGALGGRFDHEMGNINVLYRFSNVRIVLLSDDSSIFLLPRTHRHEIRIERSVEGPHCGLIPMGAPSSSSSTTGLRWNLGTGI